MQSYHSILATWESNPQIVSGPAAHFICLNSWSYSALFRDEIKQLLHDAYPSIEVEYNGAIEPIHRNVMDYTESVFSSDHCEVCKKVHTSSWAVLENTGRWVFLELRDLARIAHDQPVVCGDGVRRTALPVALPDNIAQLTLAELLDYLGILDRYTNPIDPLSVVYEFWDAASEKRILKYSTSNIVPIHQRAREFLKEYAVTYRPHYYETQGQGKHGSRKRKSSSKNGLMFTVTRIQTNNRNSENGCGVLISDQTA